MLIAFWIIFQDLFISFRLLFLLEGTTEPKEVVKFRHIRNIEKLEQFSHWSHLPSMKITYTTTSTQEEAREEAKEVSQSDAVDGTPQSDASKSGKPPSGRIGSSRKGSEGKSVVQGNADEPDEKLESFTITMKKERETWYTLLLELWCAHLAAQELRDQFLIHQASENFLLLDALFKAGLSLNFPLPFFL